MSAVGSGCWTAAILGDLVVAAASSASSGGLGLRGNAPIGASTPGSGGARGAARRALGADGGRNCGRSCRRRFSLCFVRAAAAAPVSFSKISRSMYARRSPRDMAPKSAPPPSPAGREPPCTPPAGGRRAEGRALVECRPPPSGEAAKPPSARMADAAAAPLPCSAPCAPGGPCVTVGP